MKGFLLTDVDGVLLNFMPTFETWVRGLGIAPVFRQGRTIAEYFNISEDQASQMVEAFVHDERMEYLEAFPAALEVLPRLYEAGWRFVAVTAIPTEPEIIARRRRNLERVFGLPFEAVHCVGYDGDKTNILGAYRPTVWVEDNIGHAAVGATLGHRSFLIDPRAEHLVPEGVQRVTGWWEIEQSIR
jgi:hypothetical protein